MGKVVFKHQVRKFYLKKARKIGETDKDKGDGKRKGLGEVVEKGNTELSLL